MSARIVKRHSIATPGATGNEIVDLLGTGSNRIVIGIFSHRMNVATNKLVAAPLLGSVPASQRILVGNYDSDPAPGAATGLEAWLWLDAELPGAGEHAIEFGWDDWAATWQSTAVLYEIVDASQDAPFVSQPVIQRVAGFGASKQLALTLAGQKNKLGLVGMAAGNGAFWTQSDIASDNLLNRTVADGGNRSQIIMFDDESIDAANEDYALDVTLLTGDEPESVVFFGFGVNGIDPTGLQLSDVTALTNKGTATITLVNAENATGKTVLLKKDAGHAGWPITVTGQSLLEIDIDAPNVPEFGDLSLLFKTLYIIEVKDGLNTAQHRVTIDKKDGDWLFNTIDTDEMANSFSLWHGAQNLADDIDGAYVELIRGKDLQLDNRGLFNFARSGDELGVYYYDNSKNAWSSRFVKTIGEKLEVLTEPTALIDGTSLTGSVVTQHSSGEIIAVGHPVDQEVTLDILAQNDNAQTVDFADDLGGFVHTRGSDQEVIDVYGVPQVVTGDEPARPGMRTEKNLVVDVDANDYWVSEGTAPPLLELDQTVNGLQAYASVTFTSASDAGFGGSRIRSSGANGRAEVLNGNTYRWCAYITLSRLLVGSEQINLSFTGGTGISGVTIDANRSAAYAGLWDTICGPLGVAGANANDFLAIYPNGAIASDVTISVRQFLIIDVAGRSNKNPPSFSELGAILNTQNANSVGAFLEREHQFSNDLATWNKRSGTTPVVEIDAFPGPNGEQLERLRLGGAGTLDIFTYGPTGAAFLDLECYIYKVSDGHLVVNSASGGVFGQWIVDLNALSAGLTKITSSHSAVTLVHPFKPNAAGSISLHLFRSPITDAAIPEVELGFYTDPIKYKKWHGDIVVHREGCRIDRQTIFNGIDQSVEVPVWKAGHQAMVIATLAQSVSGGGNDFLFDGAETGDRAYAYFSGSNFLNRSAGILPTIDGGSAQLDRDGQMHVLEMQGVAPGALVENIGCSHIKTSHFAGSISGFILLGGVGLNGQIDNRYYMLDEESGDIARDSGPGEKHGRYIGFPNILPKQPVKTGVLLEHEKANSWPATGDTHPDATIDIGALIANGRVFDKLIDTTAVNAHHNVLSGDMSIVAGNKYRFSCRVKADEIKVCGLILSPDGFGDNVNDWHWSIFDLENLAYGTENGIDGKGIIDEGNGVLLIYIEDTATQTITDFNAELKLYSDITTGQYTGNDTDGLYISQHPEFEEINGPISSAVKRAQTRNVNVLNQALPTPQRDGFGTEGAPIKLTLRMLHDHDDVRVGYPRIIAFENDDSSEVLEIVENPSTGAFYFKKSLAGVSEEVSGYLEYQRSDSIDMAIFFDAADGFGVRINDGDWQRQTSDFALRKFLAGITRFTIGGRYAGTNTATMLIDHVEFPPALENLNKQVRPIVAAGLQAGFEFDVADDGTNYKITYFKDPDSTHALAVRPEPTIVGPAQISAQENQPIEVAFYIRNATSAPVIAGPDAAGFTLTHDSGVKYLLTAAQHDFEDPLDGGFDNNYDIIIVAPNGTRPAIEHAARVSITDVNDTVAAPILSEVAIVQTGEGMAALTAVSDTDSGPLAAVITTTVAKPSPTQIMAGKDAEGAVVSDAYKSAITVSVMGAQTVLFAGLITPGAYWVHTTHNGSVVQTVKLVIVDLATFKPEVARVLRATMQGRYQQFNNEWALVDIR